MLKNLKNIVKFQRLNNQVNFQITDKVREELSIFQEFKQAETYRQDKKYKLAIEYYNRVLEIMGTVKQQCTPAYQQLVEEIAEISSNSNDIQLQIQSNNLYLNTCLNQEVMDEKNFFFAKKQIHLQLHNDLNEAICWLKHVQMKGELFQLNQNEKNRLQIEFLSAVVNLFQKGSIQIAVQQLTDLAKKVQDSDMLWKIQNNIAVGNWIKNYPEFNILKLEKHSYTSEDCLPKEEFDLILGNFKEALKILNKDLLEKNGDEEILSNFEKYLKPDCEKNEEIQKMYLFKKSGIFDPQSKYVLMNMVDFCIDAGKDYVKEQNFWLTQTLNFFESNNADQIQWPLSSLAFQAFLQSEILKSEGLYGTVNSSLDKESEVFKAVNKFYYGQMISCIDKREKEGEQQMKEGLEQLSNLPPQKNLLRYVQLIDQY
ncbi:hypothetical protein PPERSA_07761 [Pseudocohnilembus persalinus]|uniref:Uncharacterized protein n=1 Tax=Pseudocohnilembus persalinus TaxID=266149 RepID=A0A0V0R9R9_PSEPJ|nr:hypothetical protein PPERSA_07761 [Pseudocohnilembus persalinus]|eukprot:KRX11236.1 hypothetical protein PPERSA_07761 [Pseudocohnilembus persalinus]